MQGDRVRQILSPGLISRGQLGVFPQGRVVEIFYTMTASGIPLLRTEGVGDVNTVSLPLPKGGLIEVPVILPEKVQAKLRRILLAELRRHAGQLPSSEMRSRLRELGYKRYVGEGEEWNCHISPPLTEGGTDVGMCGYCPSCVIYGTIIDSTINEKAATSYGVKSRVAHDVAYGLADYSKAVSELTHNKVGEGVSYTGASLYSEQHVMPAVVFVGKLALYDATPSMLHAVTSSLASISRLGGRETIYGAVETRIEGVKAGTRETLTSLSVAGKVLEETRGSLAAPEELRERVRGILRENGFHVEEELVQHLLQPPSLRELWEDAVSLDEKIVEYIMRTRGKAGGSEGRGRGRQRREQGGE